MSSRVLTVSRLYASPSSTKPVPFVRVQGQWLKELGFSIGDKVEISEDREAVTIRLQKAKA